MKIHFIVVIPYASFSDTSSSIGLKNVHHLLKEDLIFIKIQFQIVLWILGGKVDRSIFLELFFFFFFSS